MNAEFIRLNAFVPSKPPQTSLLYHQYRKREWERGRAPVWLSVMGQWASASLSSAAGSLRCANTRSKESLSIFSPHSRSTEQLYNWSCDNPPIDLLHRVESAPRLLGCGLKMPRNVCQSLEHRVPEFINPYAGWATLYSVLSFFLSFFLVFQGALHTWGHFNVL